MITPLDLVVIAQQIQELTANVQELMKQNEELKQKARLRLRLCRNLNVIAMTMMTKPRVQRIAEKRLQNILHSQLVVVTK